MADGAPIFTPTAEAVARSQLTAFLRRCADETGLAFADSHALHAFSIAEPERFWGLFLRFSSLVWEGDPVPACAGRAVEHARFFPNVRLSYVENLLAGADDRPAITACDEDGGVVRLTRGALRARVLATAAGLTAQGVRAGDRVAAVARNTADTIVACLATAAIGATWSSLSPDLGLDALRDRLAPLGPVLLFVHGGYKNHGATRDISERLLQLRAALPSVRTVVLLGDEPCPAATTSLAVLAAAATAAPLPLLPRFPFDHPLFILFSSGTTGPPKCLVHGAGGTLLEHQKEHRLHSDLGPEDKLYFHATVGWMMWNWQLSALACGTEIVLYDGSVSYPDEDSLWRLIARERVTVFGTSPAFLQYCRDAGIAPAERVDLGALRAIQSTGSVLADSLYPWVRDHVKRDVPLQSISGGTDIIGCFVLGNPNLPVYAGEAQCLSFGMDVRALDGELVCASPFPSRPLGLFGDEGGRRFHEAYFSQHAGVWTHGDFLVITPRGGARILGRSDGVLNIRGVRIGPAEIYAALSEVREIAEAMALEQAAPGEPGGSRLVLLLVLRAGVTLDRPLTLRLKKELSQRCSMAHVPQAIAQVDELPTTHSGKRSERAARDALNGRPVANLGALKNPDALRAIAEHPALRLGTAP